MGGCWVFRDLMIGSGADALWDCGDLCRLTSFGLMVRVVLTGLGQDV